MTIDIAGKLFPNITTVIVQLLSTGVMLYFFKKYLWDAVRKYFQARADFIENSLNEAQDTKKEARQFLMISEQQSKQAAKEYHDIVNQAKEEASKAKDDIIKEANAQAKQKIEQANQAIEASRKAADEQMRAEIVNVALEVASKVMERNMTTPDNNRLVEQFVDEMVN